MNKIVSIGASRGNGPGISAGNQCHRPVSKPQGSLWGGIHAEKIFGADVANFYDCEYHLERILG
jgi:hypothetical protein